MSSFIKPPTKSRHRWVIGALLGIVLLGGLCNFIFTTGNYEAKEELEEYQIVDISIPPPPPPPPPEEETLEEPEELEEAVEPMEMATSPDNSAVDSSEVDLGIDIGDLVSSNGSGFIMDIPRFGRGSHGDGNGEDPLGGEMDSPPFPVNKPQPTYPSSLLKKGVGGKVIITCIVDDSGRVVSTNIKMSSGHTELDNAAIHAIGKWKFKPGMKSGKSVKATCVVPFNFEIKKA